MKTIQLKEAGIFNTKDVITVVVEKSATGVLVSEMRQRIRILDALNKADPDIILDDEDFKLLKTCLETFPYGVSNRDLLEIIDGILNVV